MVQLAYSEWIILVFCPWLPQRALSCPFIYVCDPTACHLGKVVEIAADVPVLQPRRAAGRAPVPAPPCLPALHHRAGTGGTHRFWLTRSVLVAVLADVSPFLPSPLWWRSSLQLLRCTACPRCNLSYRGGDYAACRQRGKKPALMGVLLFCGLDQPQWHVSSHTFILKTADFVSPSVALLWQPETSARSTCPISACCNAEPVLSVRTTNCLVLVMVICALKCRTDWQH